MSVNQGQTDESRQKPKNSLLIKAGVLLIVLSMVLVPAISIGSGILDYFRINRTGWSSLVAQGDQALQSGKYADAVSYYSDAIAADPEHPENASIFAGIGTAYYYSNQMEAALASFRQALVLDSDHWGALYSSGVIYQFYLKDYASALNVWNHLLSLQWEDESTREQIEKWVKEADEALGEVR
jgi:tetratricopeptide (TPR) repeat protein